MTLSDANVLIVDDEPELLEIFATWMEQAGFSTSVAANGAEALEVLMEDHVQVLISDIRMPIMDGITLLRQMYDRNVLVPSIILVSGFGDVQRREMHALGVERLLEKPLRRQHLLHAVQNSLRPRQELWAQPLSAPPAQRLQLRLDQPSSCGCTLMLGKGGCCLPFAGHLVEDQTVELAVELPQHSHTLRAQGIVEWSQPICGCAGIAFHYLEPESRAWIIEQIAATGPRSFIPQCPTHSRSTGRPSFRPTRHTG